MEYMYTHKCVVRGSCTHICKKRLREYSLRRLCLYEYEVYSYIKNMSRDFVYNFLSLFIQNEFWIDHLFVRLPTFILLFLFNNIGLVTKKRKSALKHCVNQNAFVYLLVYRLQPVWQDIFLKNFFIQKQQRTVQGSDTFFSVFPFCILLLTMT